MKNIHLIPTDKPSRLRIGDNGNFVYGMIQTSIQSRNNDFTNQHIYITSDEEIKEGDWFIHPDSSCFDKECKEVSIGGYEILKVIKVDENFIYHSAIMAIHKNMNIKKIILTTDQDLIKDGVQSIPDEFLKWFVKNPSCEYVKIEIKPMFPMYSTFIESIDNPPFYGNLKRTIIIPQEEIECSNCGSYMELLPDNSIYVCTNSECTSCYEEDEEPKQETLEEAAEKLFPNNPFFIGSGESARLYDEFKSQRDSFIAGAKWQAERMYSEEDMIEFAVWLYLEVGSNKGKDRTNKELFNKWFEQYKKK